MPAAATTVASNDIAGLCDDVRRAIGQGHRRFKIKIGGAQLADDIKRIEAVFGLLERGMSLAVDGNGTFDRDKTIAISRRAQALSAGLDRRAGSSARLRTASRHRRA